MDEKTVLDFKMVLQNALSNPDKQTKVGQDMKLSVISNIESLHGENVGPTELLLECKFPLILVSSMSDVDADITEEEVFVEDMCCERSSRKTAASEIRSVNDVEGSPLKLQTYADFSFTLSASPDSTSMSPTMRKKYVPKRKGISLSMIRKIVSYMSLAYNKSSSSTDQGPDNTTSTSDIPSLFILCDGLDIKRTAYMYAEALYLKEEDVLKWIGWKMSSACVKDPESDGSHLPNLRKLDLSGKQIECESNYDIFGSQQENEHTTLFDKYDGSLQLEVKWKTFTNSPPMDARTIIKAQVTPGNMKSAAHSLFKILEVLKTHVEGLNTMEVNWIENEAEICIMDNLKTLLEYLKRGDSGHPIHTGETSDEEFNNVMETLVFHERKDLDFTDHLWTVLYMCTSYNELVNCLKYVFTLLSNGELRPMVHRKNNTTMAQMVRESYTGKLRMPNLAGLYAIQLLAEIGAEKLQKDYIFTFLSKGLVTHSNLEPFLKTNVGLDEKLVNLEKMHHVLEMVVMLKLFLNLPSLNLAICARTMLSHYEQADIVPSYLFMLPMPTSSLKHMFETCQPCMKKLRLTKMVGSVPESVYHLLMTEQPFRHLSIKGDPLVDLDTTDKLKNKQYFYVRNNESVSILV